MTVLRSQSEALRITASQKVREPNGKTMQSLSCRVEQIKYIAQIRFSQTIKHFKRSFYSLIQFGVNKD